MNDQLAPSAILTADPSSVEAATEELVETVPGAAVLQELDDGVLLVALPSFWELAEMWRKQPPIFIRHISPVQASMPLPDDDSAIHLLLALALEELSELMEPTLPFSVQTRIFIDAAYGPYDVNTALSQALKAESSAALDVRNPRQVVSVVIARYQGQTTGFLGLSPVEYNLSDWAGGNRRFAREKEQISRSEFKLLEALEVFQIELPPRGVALDLGAAPGGWTRILRQHEQYVTAVDPAQLDVSLDADPDVRHLRMTAEKYLEAGPDRFDLIVNDMRLDARDSARLMVSYARHLYRHGSAIMTLKLPQEGQQTVIDHAFNILRQSYDIVAARQLFHNRSEITVYLKLKNDG
jgi:23S rRNA (cytidine2498-2'-O)-methyltransferase